MGIDAAVEDVRQRIRTLVADVLELDESEVADDADLSESTRSGKFAKKFPQRFFQMGIAEANMLGVAAGLSLAGKVPFCCSFAAVRLSPAASGRTNEAPTRAAYSNSASMRSATVSRSAGPARRTRMSGRAGSARSDGRAGVRTARQDSGTKP